jgi:hypothetical protein
MSFQSWGTVTVFPRLSFTVARSLLRLTSTASTPGTFSKPRTRRGRKSFNPCQRWTGQLGAARRVQGEPERASQSTRERVFFHFWDPFKRNRQRSEQSDTVHADRVDVYHDIEETGCQLRRQYLYRRRASSGPRRASAPASVLSIRFPARSLRRNRHQAKPLKSPLAGVVVVIEDRV